METIFATIGVLGIFLLLNFASSSDVNLVASSSSVNVDEDLKLTCSYTGLDTVSVMTWYIVNGAVGGSDDVNVGAILVSSCKSVGVSINETIYAFSCGSNAVTWTLQKLQKSNDGNVWACSATTSSAIFSNGVIVKVTDKNPESCSCECKCPCKIEGGKLAYTVIDFVLDACYTAVVIVVVFTSFLEDDKKKYKAVILGFSTACVVLLDIGLTVYLFTDDCEEDCECDCGPKIACILVTVFAWLADCLGYGFVLYYFIRGKGRCFSTGVEGGSGNGPQAKTSGGKGPLAKTSGGKGPQTNVSGGKGPQNSGTGSKSPVHKGAEGIDYGIKKNDYNGTQSTGVGPRPLPPQKEDSSSEVSRKDVVLENVQKRPLPSIGGGNMGTRGLSANFEDNSDFTQVGGNKLRPLPVPEISEDVGTEKRKKKKKKKEKAVESEEYEKAEFY